MTIMESINQRWLQTIVAILCGALLFLGFLQVLFRYVFKLPLGWSEEMARFVFVWIVFLGAAIGVNTKAHIAIDILLRYLPTNIVRFFRLFTEITILGFAIFLMLYGWKITSIAMRQITPALEIPWGCVYIAIPVSAFFMSLNSALNLYKELCPMFFENNSSKKL
jgi:TRAP-type C4-dicarboxylate transport system permease small subunit